MTRQLTDRPIVALVDYDEFGKTATDRLAKLGFQNKKEIISYRAVFDGPGDLTGLEAEDLWPSHIHEAFIARHGKSILSEQKRIGANGIWHYGYTKAGKELIAEFLEKKVKKGDLRLWVQLMELIREVLGVDEVEGEPAEAPERSTRPEAARVVSAAPNDTVVVPARVAYEDYKRFGAYTCQPGRAFMDGLTRIAFYMDGMIQKEIPAIRLRRDNVLFSAEEVARLRKSSEAIDHDLGNLIQRLLQKNQWMDEQRFQVFLLTRPDDARTLKLRRPIKNTKRSLRGRVTAWTQKQRYVRSDHLAQNPHTTDELDALSRGE